MFTSSPSAATTTMMPPETCGVVISRSIAS